MVVAINSPPANLSTPLARLNGRQVRSVELKVEPKSKRSIRGVVDCGRRSLGVAQVTKDATKEVEK